MRLTYWGTAAAEGWPSVFCECEACRRAAALGGRDMRTRAQALVDDTLLLDFGPDTYLHALQSGRSLARVQTVLVTHAHQDHWYPLELLMRSEPYAYVGDAPRLTVYGNEAVYGAYQRALRWDDSPNLPARVRFQVIEPLKAFDTADGYRVTPLPAKHDPGIPCLIYLVAKGGKTLLYAHDTGVFPEETWRALEGVRLDLVSLDCTNQGLDYPGGHMGLKQDALVRDRLKDMGCIAPGARLIVNHFSHNGGMTHEQLTAAAAALGFEASWDGMRAEV